MNDIEPGYHDPNDVESVTGDDERPSAALVLTGVVNTLTLAGFLAVGLYQYAVVALVLLTALYPRRLRRGFSACNSDNQRA